MRGLKKILTVTLFATLAEYAIYYFFQGRFGLTVDPETIMKTLPFMLFTNFISAHIAQKIFTGQVHWNGKTH